MVKNDVTHRRKSKIHYMQRCTFFSLRPRYGSHAGGRLCCPSSPGTTVLCPVPPSSFSRRAAHSQTRHLPYPALLTFSAQSPAADNQSRLDRLQWSGRSIAPQSKNRVPGTKAVPVPSTHMGHAVRSGVPAGSFLLLLPACPAGCTRCPEPETPSPAQEDHLCPALRALHLPSPPQCESAATRSRRNRLLASAGRCGGSQLLCTPQWLLH